MRKARVHHASHACALPWVAVSAAVLAMACGPVAPASGARKPPAPWPERTAGVGDLVAHFASGHPDHVVEPGDEATPAVVVTNRGGEAQEANVYITVRSFDDTVLGHEHPVRVPAGGSVRVPVPKDAFIARGIKWVGFRVIWSAEHSKTARAAFAYMEPTGPKPSLPTVPRPEPGAMRFGMAYGASPDNYSETAARKTGRLGVDIARIPIYWSQCEPRDGEWNWDRSDGAVVTYAAHGVGAFGLIMNTPGWARVHGPKSENPFARLDAWRDFITHLARHYRGRIRYWEVWNEPDIDFFKGTADEYRQMLRAAYEAFKAVDPDMQVMTGGFVSLAHHGRKDGMIETVIREDHASFDLLAYHTHGPFKGHFQTELDDRLLPYMRKVLKEPKPVFFTETGMDCRLGEHHQARTLAKKVVFAWSRGAVVYTWFNLHDMLRAEGPRHMGQTYGLYTPYRRNDPKAGWKPENVDYPYAWPKASYVAYNTLIALLHGARYVKPLSCGEGGWAFVFRRGDRHVVVAWREAKGGDSLTLRTDATKAETVDLMGNHTSAAVDGARLRLPLDETPVYVILDTVEPPAAETR